MSCEVLNIGSGDNHGHFKEHVIFKVTFDEDKPAEETKESNKSKKKSKTNLNDIMTVATFSPTFPETALITPQIFCQVFPFHLIFDSDLMIQQSGVNVQRFCHLEENGKHSMTEVFHLIHPTMPLTFQHILRFINANFIIEVKAKDKCNGWKLLRQSRLVLKGL